MPPTGSSLEPAQLRKEIMSFNIGQQKSLKLKHKEKKMSE